MRVKIASSLLILGSSFGCYVQPYNPPPGQVGQAPVSDQQLQPQPGYTPPPPDQQPPPVVQTPPPAQPATPVYTGPVYDNFTGNVAGNSVPSVDVFYNDLAPYG